MENLYKMNDFNDKEKYFLKVEDLQVSYRKELVLNEFNLQVKQEEIICLLGASGCGKTTFLNTLTGFVRFNSGRIIIENEVISNEKIPLRKRKKIAMVFQDYALFPHLSVFNNIAFSLSKLSKIEKKREVEAIANELEIEKLLAKYPHEISGGQKQRVSLARSLVFQPLLLLMDEPFSSQDAQLKEKLLIKVKSIIRKIKTTVIWVTHDQKEALMLSDKVGFMNKGKIEQIDKPYNIYHQPISKNVASFIGKGILVNGYMLKNGSIDCGFTIINEKIVKESKVLNYQLDFKQEKVAIFLFLRPNNVIIERISKEENKEEKQEKEIKGIINKEMFLGENSLYEVVLFSGEKLLSLVANHLKFNHKEKVKVRFSFKNGIIVFLR